uniref:Uncharacterized protein n=1 Tax=Timema douglasi TaxID=61478 RepID=A0A7R8VGB8_TIMDO|nr:unnamed protein product [Timema douglasi]
MCANCNFYLPAKISDIMGKLEHLGAVYNAMALLLADTWEHTIPDQNLLVRLHKAECHAAMADVSAQFSMFIQKQDHLLQQACPASKFFKEAHLAIKRFSRNIPKMDIKDALAYVVALEKEQCSIKVITDGALSAVKLNTTCALANYATKAAIPNDCKLINPSASNPYQKFLEECEDKRVKLLQLVSNVQFENTKKCVKSATLMTNQLFPLHVVLEVSLVEEMAALQKCQEMGNTSAADRMVELLSLRIVWLQLQFKKWSTESMNPTGPSQAMPFFSLRSGIAEIVTCSWINLLPLKIMFRVYLSKFGTTHPFSEVEAGVILLDAIRTDSPPMWTSALPEIRASFKNIVCSMTYLKQFLPTRFIFPEMLCLQKDWCMGFIVFEKSGDIPSLFMKGLSSDDSEFITGEMRHTVDSCQFNPHPKVTIQNYNLLGGSNDANKKTETTESKTQNSPKPKLGDKKESSFVNKPNTKTSANKCNYGNSDEKLKSKNCQKKTTDQMNINSEVHSTEIRTSIPSSSAVELNTTSALANYTTEVSALAATNLLSTHSNGCTIGMCEVHFFNSKRS